MTWIEELQSTVGITPHFVLSGSTWDYVVGREAGPVRALPVIGHLLRVAEHIGLRYLVIADPVQGFTLTTVGGDEEADAIVRTLPPALARLERHGAATPRGAAASTPAQLAEVIGQVEASPVLGGLVVVDAGRWIIDVRSLSDEEHALFALASSAARGSLLRDAGDGRRAHAPVWWLCRTERELPDWYLSDPCVRGVVVPSPDWADRERLGGALVGPEVTEAFADATDGLSTRELLSVGQLVGEGQDVVAAATLVRLGVTDDPWADPGLMARLRDGRAELGADVRGQDRALDAAWASTTRSVMGLSGIHRPSSGRRPRIVLFLAGPTGTGKTQLAKALAQRLFRSDRALLRFDMSGYGESHSAQRLIGSPPGFVGHAAGGELTNAVRQHPFSVILFDEIEKAHPDILKLFLQVLDEGHLDDSLGRRVFFDQSVIVFTSNLGVRETIREPGRQDRSIDLVTEEMSYEELQPRVVQGITDHFVGQLGSPEILNRVGDNLVVFDFIRPDAAREIFAGLLDHVVDGVRDRHGVELEFAPEVREALEEVCCQDLSMGGRGISNMVESQVLNPLAVWMFDHHKDRATRLRITGWRNDGSPSMEIES